MQASVGSDKGIGFAVVLALLITLVLLFSFKGDVILGNPLTIVWTT